MDSTPEQPPAQEHRILVKVQGPGTLLNYNATRAKSLGIAQLLLGAACVTLTLIGFLTNSDAPEVYGDRSRIYYWRNEHPGFPSIGAWFPVYIFSTSATATIVASRKQTKHWIGASLVLSAIASGFATVMAGFALWAFTDSISRLQRDNYYTEVKPFEVTNITDVQLENTTYIMRVDISEGTEKVSLGVSSMFVAASIAEVIVCVLTVRLCIRVFRPVKDPSAIGIRAQVTGHTSEGTTILLIDSRGRSITGTQPIQIPTISDSPALGPRPQHPTASTAFLAQNETDPETDNEVNQRKSHPGPPGVVLPLTGYPELDGEPPPYEP